MAFDLDSDAMEYTYTFKWKVTVFGVNPMFGDGEVVFQSNKMSIEQFFVNSKTKTSFKTTWASVLTEFNSPNKKGAEAKTWV